jgi:hypothetical protein
MHITGSAEAFCADEDAQFEQQVAELPDDPALEGLVNALRRRRRPV